MNQSAQIPCPPYSGGEGGWMLVWERAITASTFLGDDRLRVAGTGRLNLFQQFREPIVFTAVVFFFFFSLLWTFLLVERQ